MLRAAFLGLVLWLTGSMHAGTVGGEVLTMITVTETEQADTDLSTLVSDPKSDAPTPTCSDAFVP